ncbi:7380_t:CDS:2 [Diversispora eburnea]|uniref:7380_t:CDS:1 n=1 Tax=Diversispora eburnea TaxID=1213867 RepID=A0A9N9FYL4_9GLOM|nr:7380_t:CDS:2 [Diversispora eburnea]
MSQEIEKIDYCPAGHSSVDFAYSDCKNFIGYGRCINVVLKEINDSRFDMVEFFKVIKAIHDYDYEYIATYYGISKNLSTQNYIIVMESFDGDLHNFLTENFWDLSWKTKIDILASIVSGLESLRAKNLVHCNLHSGNILKFTKYSNMSVIDYDLGKLFSNIVDNNVMHQLEIADENQKNTSKSRKQELFELSSHSSKLHPQSCYIGRYIHTLHGLNDLLVEIKSGKSSDPNLLLKSNKSSTSSVNDHNIDEEAEIQSKQKCH